MCIIFDKGTGWAALWAILSQTHLVTLITTASEGANDKWHITQFIQAGRSIATSAARLGDVSGNGGFQSRLEMKLH
jgi:hypothetical protein